MVARQNVVLRAFTEDQVVRLTNVSRDQLRHWDRTRFFRPEFAADNRRLAYSRLYSFKDVCSLRVIAQLRNEHKVPLQHLRKVAEKLSHLAQDKWTCTTLYVINKKVAVVDPDTDLYREIVSNQYALPNIKLADVVSSTQHDIDKLNRRSASETGRIEQARRHQKNAKVFAGTRVPVMAIKHFWEDGYTVEQILDEYPRLTRRDVEVAINNGEAAA